ncbi:MAG: hypothetical protein KME18_26480 [Phormidium tanganyikae FI6-MK23]|jgi:hypothetical protein|nr:hypothetical protein [Phormidium tanganyikae FI6-MK23]
MARPSYGAATQSRSRILFTVLLDYANEELETEESSIEVLRPQIQTHWQSERRLIVRTKVRFLEALTKLVYSPLSADQIKESLRRFEDYLGILEDNRPNRGGSEVWHFQQFVDTIYAWKQDYFPITPTQRQQLNYVLGQVALRALAQSETRFRLPYSFVQQAFGNAIDLMPLALQLGWLNQVSTTSGEKVYAFYHSSFQEYFAAQAIDDWHFFFENFAIFQSHWREVIFLWLGRTDLAIAQKESFIQALLNFDDRCGGFYTHRAFFLAVSGLSEFPQSQNADQLLTGLIQHRFSSETLAPVREAARIALLQTDRQTAIAKLEQFVCSTPDVFARWTAAYTLGKTLDYGNSHAVDALIEVLNTIENTMLRLNVCDQLERINPGNRVAFETL